MNITFAWVGGSAKCWWRERYSFFFQKYCQDYQKKSIRLLKDARLSSNIVIEQWSRSSSSSNLDRRDSAFTDRDEPCVIRRFIRSDSEHCPAPTWGDQDRNYHQPNEDGCFRKRELRKNLLPGRTAYQTDRRCDGILPWTRTWTSSILCGNLHLLFSAQGVGDDVSRT